MTKKTTISGKTDKPDRKTHILNKLRTAMHAIQADARYDWSRTSEAICEAASTLTEATQTYIEEKITEAEIKPLYKSYVKLHLKTGEERT